MEDNKPITPIIPEMKQPTFEDPLSMVSNDIKSKTGTVPPTQGGSSVTGGSDPLAQAMAAYDNNKGFSFTSYDVGMEEAYETLNDGTLVKKFENFEKSTNNEDRLAKLETTGEKWANGLAKFGIKTGTAVLGGTIGTVEGIINGVSQGSWDAVYNSDFNKWLDDVNTKVDYSLPNYYTEQEKDKGLLSSMGTANFWANDVLGGLSFTVGTIVSEGIWAAATGGTSLIARGGVAAAKAAKWSSRVLGRPQTLKGIQAATKAIKQPYINASKVKKVFDQARFLTTSAGYESGFEARHYMKETEGEWKAAFEKENGRMPLPEELGEFKEGLTKSANAVFATNFALVGFSNQVTLGKLLLGKSTVGAVKNNTLKRKLFGLGYDKADNGAIKALTPNKYQKAMGRLYGFAKPAIAEGVIEEGGQSVASGTAKNFMLSAYSPEGTNESISLTEAFYDSMAETYGTKQGFKEVGIGMIIGILGGGASSGFKFNDVAEERTQLNQRINYRNQFTAENVVDRLKANNKIFEANRRGEKAKIKGDLTGELMSERDVMLATIERDYHFEGAREGVETFTTAMGGVDLEQLADQLGINVEEAAQWRDDKVTKYKDLTANYAKNKAFAQSLTGTGKISGLENPGVKAEIEKAIAYNITMGMEVDTMADEYIENIKQEIGSNFSDSDILSVLDVDNLLRRVDDKTELEYQKASLQQDVLTEKRDKLAKTLREVQNKVTTPENKVQVTERLGNLQEALLEIEEELEGLRNTKETLLTTMELQFPESTDIVTEEMLDNQGTRAKKLDDLIEGMKQSNPERYGRIHKLLQEYQRSTKVAKEFQQTTKNLFDPKLRVIEINGWVDGLMKKGKGLNDFSNQYFSELLDKYRGNTTRTLEDNIAAEAAINSEGTDSNPTSEADDITPPDPVNEPKMSQREILEGMINDIANSNKYVVDYFGNSEKEILKTRPSKSDITKYRNLLDKIPSGRRNEVLLAEENPKDSGLTKKEFDELQEVNEVLADWRLLEGAVNGQGDSITGLIELLDTLNDIEVRQNTNTEVGNQEFIKISQAVNGQTGSRPVAAAVKSPDVALVSIKNDSLSNKEVYQFSHLKIGNIERLFPNSKLFFIDSEGVKKDFNSATDSVKKKLGSTVGSQFVLETPVGDLPIKLKSSKRLEMPVDIARTILPTSNIKIVNFGISKFLSVYEKLGEGQYIPLQGDFDNESILKNEIIKLDEVAISKLESGTIVRTEINLNDAFNVELIKQYKKDKDLQKLESQLQVFITDTEGKLIGSLAAFTDSLPEGVETDSLIQLRKRAAKIALTEGAKGRVDLKMAVPVRTVLTGAPKLNLEEQVDGSVQATNIPFTLDAVSEVKAVGYFQNGEINVDKKIDNSKINTIFVKNLTEAGSGTRVPVIVFEANNQQIAYPVSLNNTKVDRSGEVIDILRTDLSSGEKLAKIYQMLAANGVDPRQFSIDITQQGWEGSDEIQSILESVRSLDSAINVEDWVNGGYNYNNLTRDAAISIDITNNPFQIGKVILDLSNIESGLDKASQEELAEALEEVEVALSDFAVDVDTEMRTNPAFVNMDNSFTRIFDDNPVEETPNAFSRKKNVKITKLALDTKITSQLQDIMGRDRIKRMKKLAVKHTKLAKQRGQYLASIKNSNLQSQVNSQKTNC